jgi:hypothetical protein
LEAILRKHGCIPLPRRGKGSHTIWTTPGGLTFPIPTGHREVSPGVASKLQAAFEQELGPKWLEKEKHR